MKTIKDKTRGERQMKIQPKHFPRVNQTAVFPEIRLSGKWLQNAGFSCNDRVIVQHKKNKITITLNR